MKTLLSYGTRTTAFVLLALSLCALNTQAQNTATSPTATTTNNVPPVEEKIITTKSGLQYIDIVEGTGPSPKLGQRVVVNYVGRLENGRKFDSSYDRMKPFKFYINMGTVIRGWDEGVSTMKAGGKRKLIIPPRLGYGSSGQGDLIPPNSTLIFEVELLAIEGEPQ
jgi:peptidylprolyl isomerase